MLEPWFSALNFFHLQFGMKKELCFSYMVCMPEPKFQAWNVFKALVARNYDELMAKCVAMPPPNSDGSGGQRSPAAALSSMANNGCLSKVRHDHIAIRAIDTVQHVQASKKIIKK